MADEAARRRELRRRRILDNAEERRRKIFGTTKAPSEPKDNGVCEDPPVPCLADQQPLPAKTFPPRPSATPNLDDPLGDSILSQGSSSLLAPSSTQAIDEDTGTTSHGPLTSTPRKEGQSPSTLHPSARQLNGTLPGTTDQLLNFSRVSAPNGTVGSPIGSPLGHEAQLQPVPEPPRSAVVPVVLALVVCCLLSLNLGYIVSHSIAFPFLLWEGHSLWCRWQALQAGQGANAGLVAFALMLSGVSQTTITSFLTWINITKCFVEDFSLYIFTVVVWHNVLGLPEALQHQADAAAAAAAAEASLGLGAAEQQGLDDTDVFGDF